MRITLLILTLLSIQTTHENWFTEFFSSSYKYLKKKLMPDRKKFIIEGMDDLHKETVEKFLEIKEDGLGISYTLIYYNLMLNLERECFFVADKLKKCEQFVAHIQSIITSHVKIEDKDYEFPLIGEFYSSIFDLSKLDTHDPVQKRLRETLEELKEHFEGEKFRPTREALTEAYNGSLQSVMEYLNSNADQEILRRADPEIQQRLGQDEYIGY